MTSENRGTYWTFTIISILAAGVLGYVGGYWMKSQQIQPTLIVNDQPNVQADIFNQLISQADTAKTLENSENEEETLDTHNFSGYVRNISDTSVELENPDSIINGSSTYTFTLQNTTQYFQVDNVIVDNQPDYKTTILTAQDIHVGDIIAIYTPENIQTAEVRFVESVELIANAPENIDQK